MTGGFRFVMTGYADCRHPAIERWIFHQIIQPATGVPPLKPPCENSSTERGESPSDIFMNFTRTVDMHELYVPTISNYTIEEDKEVFSWRVSVSCQFFGPTGAEYTPKLNRHVC